MFERGNFSNFIEFFDGDPAVYEIWVEEFPKCYKVYVIYSTDNLKFITYIYNPKESACKEKFPKTSYKNDKIKCKLSILLALSQFLLFFILQLLPLWHVCFPGVFIIGYIDRCRFGLVLAARRPSPFLFWNWTLLSSRWWLFSCSFAILKRLLYYLLMFFLFIIIFPLLSSMFFMFPLWRRRSFCYFLLPRPRTINVFVLVLGFCQSRFFLVLSLQFLWLFASFLMFCTFLELLYLQWIKVWGITLHINS